MARLVFIINLYAVLYLPAAWASIYAGLTFTDGGEIVGSTGKVSIARDGGITITTETNDIYARTIPAAVRGGGTLWNSGGLQDKRVDFDPATQQTTFSAKLVDKVLTLSMRGTLSKEVSCKFFFVQRGWSNISNLATYRYILVPS